MNQNGVNKSSILIDKTRSEVVSELPENMNSCVPKERVFILECLHYNYYLFVNIVNVMKILAQLRENY